MIQICQQDYLTTDWAKQQNSSENALKWEAQSGLMGFGGPPETRTPDPLIKSQLLYQLS